MFVKKNPLPGSDSLVCERQGLQLIEKSFSRHGLHTPKVVSADRDELVLEKIETVDGTPEQFAELGEKLAALHRIHGEKFGLDHDNYIGLNRQKNVWHENWGEFFVEYRLQFQLDMIEHRILKTEFSDLLQKKKSALVDYLNRHDPKPSLLHGDLWGGNVLFSQREIYIIDPAVYFGDRECDLAMTGMFGGFAGVFYEAYQRSYPLPDGYVRRFEIYNLYHYLNHYNLFGEGYLSGVRKGFRMIDTI